MTLAEIAGRQEITVPYLEQIFSKLRRGGIVKSVKGPGGGYVLAKEAGELPISDIIGAVDEPIKMTPLWQKSPEKQACLRLHTRKKMPDA